MRGFTNRERGVYRCLEARMRKKSLLGFSEKKTENYMSKQQMEKDSGDQYEWGVYLFVPTEKKSIYLKIRNFFQKDVGRS